MPSITLNRELESEQSLDAVNDELASLTARERVAWSLEHLPATQVLSSSFGIQAAVSLHLLTQQSPDIPVVLVDTGYLFPETYQFVDRLQKKLGFNLKVHRPRMSAAWQEAHFGRLWEQGADGLDHYNRLNKVEPMARALEELGAKTWYSGLRREQSTSRTDTPFVEFVKGRYKVHPIADWTSRDVWLYLKKYDLPYHPLWEEGFVSVGDVHTTQRWQPGMAEEETRFFGMKRECGLHTEL